MGRSNSTRAPKVVLIRRLAFFLASLLFYFAGPVCAPSLAANQGAPQSSGENEFSVSVTLFSTLAAINAAGYDAGMDSPLNERYRVRTQVREALAKRNIACLPEFQAFYKEHKKASDTADLSQYISFALVAGDAPKFDLPAGPLPPDVEALKGFSDLLARFYKEADLESLWNRSQAAYAAAMSEYQEAVIGTLFEANGYLRNPSGYLGRRFQIYLDLLAAPDQVQVRNYRDDCFVVITPTSTPVVDEIRDAYLAYLLDPLTFKYSEVIKDKKPLQKFAQEAPALDLAYKDDFSLLVTKCLIKAIDSRLMHGGSEKRQAFVNEAMREGFILTAAFADLLPTYEKQQDAFRLYYPDLVSAVDVSKEQKRLKKIDFVQTIAPRVIAPPAKMQLEPADQSLITAEGLYEQHNLDEARKTFKKVFEQTNDKARQGRAWYGLALIDLEEKHWDEALDLFQRTIDATPNSAITAWSHYYLGQLALKAGDSDKATAQFKLTLATNGASAKAREAAEKALQSNTGEQNQ
ncbi:MAG: tetratricopeptide repeat protein [Acidobacteriaceae bacterium]|nr:tetratricopeptide repeat protein [Acidobacteriaceae bacterium]MBV9295239.1 tetratricopeptide repeat protein [Acidobacteriaceae bacterium]MBV9767451.1 tetratricopeptide repeat protein [Acidobacteriaceae bacterium]